MHPMIRRQRAAQACVDAYAGKPLDWGKSECLKLFRFALHQQGVKCGKAPTYTTEMGAVRAMKKAGFDTLAEAVDAQGLVRIAPAAALPGDIIALPAEGAFGCALTVFVGNGRVLAYYDGRCQVIQPNAYVTAWRVA